MATSSTLQKSTSLSHKRAFFRFCFVFFFLPALPILMSNETGDITRILEDGGSMVWHGRGEGVF